MFRIPDETYGVLTVLGDMKGCNGMRDAIGLVAKVAREHGERLNLEIRPVPENAPRKSVSIEEEDKIFFAEMARRHGVSRDTAFYSCVSFLVDLLGRIRLTTAQKLEHARILKNTLAKMVELFNSPEAVAAREALMDCDDPDFGSGDDPGSCYDCLEKMAFYMDRLPLDEFLAAKERELEQYQDGQPGDEASKNNP